MNWTKREVKTALGIETDAELARLLRIRNRQAVNQWPDAEPIPEARQWQLALLRPDVFSSAAVRAA
jgi:hypothetical protein